MEFHNKHIALKVDVLQGRKYTVCMRIRAYFGPEILKAAAVKGLNPIPGSKHMN